LASPLLAQLLWKMHPTLYDLQSRSARNAPGRTTRKAPPPSDGLNMASLSALPLRFRAMKIPPPASEGAEEGDDCEVKDDDSASDMDAVNAPRMLPRFANAFSSL
jgi:hypothetical protein